MIPYTPKHLLGRNYDIRHFPYCHFEIHLWELEQSFEEAGHASFGLVCRGIGVVSHGECAGWLTGIAIVSRERYLSGHGFSIADY